MARLALATTNAKRPVGRASARPRLGQHLCCLYESETEMEAMALPFILAGMSAGEKCAVVAAEARLAVIEEQLALNGLDTMSFLASGQLVLRADLSGCTLTASAVNMAGTASASAGVDATSLSEGFSGYRCVFAVTDFLCHMDGQSLIEREIVLNRLLSKLPATLLLLYDRRLMSEAIMKDMMELHPRLVDRGDMYENPAYILPEELL